VGFLGSLFGASHVSIVIIIVSAKNTREPRTICGAPGIGVEQGLYTPISNAIANRENVNFHFNTPFQNVD
jgi:hypothetical protein